MKRRGFLLISGAALLSACSSAAEVANVTDSSYAGGADPTGESDSAEAFRAAVASNRPVYVPPGKFLFEGAGIDHPAPNITGSGPSGTTIILGKDTYFLDSNRRWDSLNLRGIRFNSGAGHIRNRYTGTNVTNMFTVVDCEFIGYGDCAISHNSTDHPYWKIERNIFRADNDERSIGVALSGLTDGTSIVDNEFLINRVHVKLGEGGNNTYIERNDFLRFLSPAKHERIDIWFVPAASIENSGSGLVIRSCKFGNENLSPSDFRIVYADDAPGHLFGAGVPNLSQPSAGYVSGHSISDVQINGIGEDVRIPVIFSATPNVLGCHYGPVFAGGGQGAPLLRVLRPLSAPRSNIVGPLVTNRSDVISAGLIEVASS